MAHYLVTAKPKSERVGDLLANLRNRAYFSMRQNARLREDGYAIWEEEDYCSSPLAQERAAALDEFFSELEIAQVKEGAGWKEIEQLPRLFPDLEQRRTI